VVSVVDYTDALRFQSAPLREGRPPSSPTLSSSAPKFQSAPLREGRLADYGTPIWAFAVSIRAPARGATGVEVEILGVAIRFNPRPCARGDEVDSGARQSSPCFNPRPCARGDSGAPDQGTTHPVRFNPRPCARGDARACHASWPRRGFNPRPCARGDAIPSFMHMLPVMFQSAPLREGRPAKAMVTARASRGFNPRPCARGDM